MPRHDADALQLASLLNCFSDSETDGDSAADDDEFFDDWDMAELEKEAEAAAGAAESPHGAAHSPWCIVEGEPNGY